MPSFDVVSKVDPQEIDNAVNQAMKEIGQRYDFKGAKVTLTLDKDGITALAPDDYKLEAALDILQTKCVKRQVSLKALQYGTVEPASGGTVRQRITIQQGVSKEKGKDMGEALKHAKLKVQAQIQDDQLRVSGKNRDDLQAAIALLKGQDFGLDLQFTNFRD